MNWEDIILDATNNEANKGIPTLSPPLEVGTVIEPPPNLVIDMRGLQLRRDKGQLLINNFLLKDYIRTVDIEWEDPYLHTMDEHQETKVHHKKNIDATVTTKDELRVGDEVILIPFAGKQKWFVSCKVV